MSGDLYCLQDSWFREDCKSRGALYEGTGFFNIRDTDEKSLHTFSWNFEKAFKMIKKSSGLDSQTRKNKLVLFFSIFVAGSLFLLLLTFHSHADLCIHSTLLSYNHCFWKSRTYFMHFQRTDVNLGALCLPLSWPVQSLTQFEALKDFIYFWMDKIFKPNAGLPIYKLFNPNVIPTCLND